MHTHKFIYRAREQRLCFYESEPTHTERPTQSKVPKNSPITEEAMRRRKYAREHLEKKSVTDEATAIQRIEETLRLQMYTELQSKIFTLTNGGRRADMETIARTMSTLAMDDPNAPGEFARMSVGKLAITDISDLQNMLLVIRERIDSLNAKVKENTQAEILESAEHESPLVDMSVTMGPDTRFDRTYTSTGTPFQPHLTKDTHVRVRGFFETEDSLWIKLDTPSAPDATSKNEYIIRDTLEGLSHEISKDDLRRTIARYDAIMKNAKTLKKGRGDIRKFIDQIDSLRTFLTGIISGEADMSLESSRSYIPIIQRLGYAGNFLRCSIADIAIMEKEDFDAFIPMLERYQDSLLQKLDTEY